MQMLDDATEAYLLKDIADATDKMTSFQLPANAATGKFIAHGWIRNVGDGAGRFVITEAGRQALVDWRGRNNR
jgi:hypothetical protein